MKTLLALAFVGLFSLCAFCAPKGFPSVLLGTWTVGAPYDAHQPVGLDRRQEDHIVGLVLHFAKGAIRVCGKRIAIRSLKFDSLSEGGFVNKYGFDPRVIGMLGLRVSELYINFPDSGGACGDYNDPGTHVFFDSHKHIVIEVANDYFPLELTR